MMTNEQFKARVALLRQRRPDLDPDMVERLVAEIGDTPSRVGDKLVVVVDGQVMELPPDILD